MEPLRILVLTSSTGGGHDARAAAFADWCFRLYQHQVHVRIEHMLEKSSVLNRAGVGFYNWIQRSAPWMHKGFYAFVELLAVLNRRDVVLGSKYYHDVLRSFQPHAVLSVHDCLNRGYFQAAREELGEDRVKCITYCGEFSGGWGYSRNWLEPTVDLYISRTRTAQAYARKKGIPADRSRVRGHLMQPRAYEQIIRPEQKGEYRRRVLELDPDLFTVFLATGTNGANNHFALLPTLLRHAERCQVVIICGRNTDLFHELVRWRAENPALRCHIQGFSDTVHLLLQVSDVIVTKGGTTTCAKALHYGCPIIFNAFQGIMPQEQLTWKFFRNGGSTPKIEDAADFREIMDQWLEEPGAFAQYRERFLGLQSGEEPTAVIKDVISLAEEVARQPVALTPFVPRESSTNWPWLADTTPDPAQP